MNCVSVLISMTDHATPQIWWVTCSVKEELQSFYLNMSFYSLLHTVTFYNSVSHVFLFYQVLSDSEYDLLIDWSMLLRMPVRRTPELSRPVSFLLLKCFLILKFMVMSWLQNSSAECMLLAIFSSKILPHTSQSKLRLFHASPSISDLILILFAILWLVLLTNFIS